MRLGFLFALLLALSANAQEAQNVYPLQSVTFTRQSLGNGTFDAWRTEVYNSLPVKTPAWPGNVTNRGYISQVLATQKPPGTSVMWGTWRFTSKGLFTSAPNSHVAFIVRSTSTALSNVGYGFIVGGLSGLNDVIGGPCASGIRTQPETWHENPDGSAGNVLYGGAFCGPVLLDWRQYEISIHAAETGYSYSIRDMATNSVVFSTYVYTPSSPSAAKIAKASGWTSGVVFADIPGSNWQFEITDLQLGWF